MSLILPNRRLAKSELDEIKKSVYVKTIDFKDVWKNFDLQNRAITYNTLWLLREIVDDFKNEMEAFLPISVRLLNQYHDDEGIIRNVISILQFIEIKQPHDGEILDYSFKYLHEFEWAVAIKAFSMTVAFNISKPYPELLHELKELIKNNIHSYGSESPAILSRGNKVLKKINQHLRR